MKNVFLTRLQENCFETFQVFGNENKAIDHTTLFIQDEKQHSSYPFTRKL